ncbi:adenosylcobinamide-phosphate synthase CbiB [Peteryoungia ipomoeae]|uniref:Cobalamin biosynthesis protein CobD n=1 Tax=Peteryoungia ipomoeae TaxID=1210932 RepID=A0A4V4HN75_9HYPH|nr:adenosylcobinamide-phosphate synthase CbiB [Peteryoungia ipomoeae]THV25036.1 cobalamin biosynthesis protein [Peteryoungia ipomoeae]
MTTLAILALGLAMDRVVGDPDWLWRRWPHPVVFFGKAIEICERRLNRESLSFAARRRNGVVTAIGLLCLAAVTGFAIKVLLRELGLLGFCLEAIVVAIFLAHKSLADHVMAVYRALSSEGLDAGRRAVSKIVGRDPAALNGSGVVRAAIESLAENFADGVVAPAFWYAVGGLPGLLAYKMLNTADSMIGHKSDRYRAFGWAAARLDDVANWPAARLSALLIAAGALVSIGRSAARMSLSAALRDHGLHRSPNSGWPEAAMAGALDLQLAGPRIYAGERVSEPMMHAAGRAEATTADIERAVSIFHAAWASMFTLVVIVAVTI